jgi:hypothetical protein
MCDNFTLIIGGFTTAICYFLSLNTKITLVENLSKHKNHIYDLTISNLFRQNMELKKRILAIEKQLLDLSTEKDTQTDFTIVMEDMVNNPQIITSLSKSDSIKSIEEWIEAY